MDEIIETVFETVQGRKTWTVSTLQKKWKAKIKKLAEKFPDEVEIVSEDEHSICARVPAAWVKLSPKRIMNYTEEQKAAMVERMRKNRKSWGKSEAEEDEDKNEDTDTDEEADEDIE